MPPKNPPVQIPKYLQDAFEGPPASMEQALERLSLATHAMLRGDITAYQHAQISGAFKVSLPALKAREEARADLGDLSAEEADFVSAVAEAAVDWVRQHPDATLGDVAFRRLRAVSGGADE